MTMKKMIGLMIMAGVLLAGLAQAADTYQEVTITVTNAGTGYANITMNGFLDKVEYTHTGGTGTVTLATFAADGTTAVDTMVTKQIVAAGSGVLARPRIVGTTTAGVALAAVVGNGSDALTNLVSTVLSVPYERARLGGNAKVRLVSDGSGGACTTVIRVYVIPFDK